MNIAEKLAKKWARYKDMKNEYAKKALQRSRDKRDKFIKFLDNLISMKLIDNEIINELGASFSSMRREGDRITKFARPDAEQKIRDELEWYLRLKKSLGEDRYRSFLPEILAYSLDKNNVFYTMKHYSMPTLRTLIFEYKIKEKEIIRRVESVLDSLVSDVYSLEDTIPVPEDYVEGCHQQNIVKRVKYAVKMNPQLGKIVGRKTISINGRECINATALLSAVFRDKAIMKKLQPPKLWIIHGDMHYNNILSSPFRNKNILIDCRGRSPYGTVQCDVALDIAKIYHEIRSYYSIIERNEYNLFLHETAKGTEINFEFTNRGIKRLYDSLFGQIDALLQKKFSAKEFGNWKYRADFIEGKLYVTMLPFHIEPFSESVVCYATGVMRLNEWLERYHPALYRQLRGKHMSS